MEQFRIKGQTLRTQAKDLVLGYMKNELSCAENEKGMTQADIFRNCGFDWGDYSASKSTQQQFWLVALLKELEEEKKITQLENKHWRLV